MDEAAYMTRRAEQERRAALAAKCPEARVIHETMRARYVALAAAARPLRLAA